MHSLGRGAPAVLCAAHRHRNTTFKEEFEKVTAQACRIAIRECALQRSAGRAGDALQHAGPPLEGGGLAVTHVRTVKIRFQAAVALNVVPNRQKCCLCQVESSPEAVLFSSLTPPPSQDSEALR